MAEKKAWAAMERADRIAAIRELTVPGNSASAIGKAPGTSRNSVIGNWARARDAGEKWPPQKQTKKTAGAASQIVRRLKRRRSDHKSTKPNSPGKKRTSMRIGTSNWVRNDRGNTAADRAKRGQEQCAAFELKRTRDEKFAPLPGSRPIVVRDIPRKGRCRWPVDGVHGKDLIQCGAATQDGCVYCPTHKQFAVDPPKTDRFRKELRNVASS